MLFAIHPDPEWRDRFAGAVVLIGNFDGLHLGHQALLKHASGLNGPKVVITFDPHPLQVLRPEQGLKRLFPRADLAEQLPRFGVDLCLVLTFTPELAALSAGVFLDTYLAPLFAPAHVVAGYDFQFGQNRQGSETLLRRWCGEHGTQLHVLPPVRLDGDIVSSRRVRDFVAGGDVAMAARCLGRPFYVRGQVGRGAGRGAGIGFPTLNQIVENETVPALGVYATRTRVQGRDYASVTNVGVTPTFTTDGLVKIETHVLGQNLELRGANVDVDFIARLRPEMKFAGVPDLKKQIDQDILKAREILKHQS